MQNPYEKYVVKRTALSGTKRKFMDAMEQLLKSGRDFNNVSVSELCRAANLSRTMFYNVYQNIGDVIDDMQDEFLYKGSELAARFYHTPPYMPQTTHFLLEFLQFMLEHKNSYYWFINAPYGADKRFVEKWKRIIKYRFFEYYADRPDYDFILEVVSGALVNALTYYVNNINKFPQQQFLESFSHLYKVVTSY